MAQALPNPQFYYMPTTGAFFALAALGIGGQIRGSVWSTSVENDGGSAYEVWTVQASGTSAASFSIYPTLSSSQAVTISGAAAGTATLVATNLETAFKANAVAFGLASVTRSTDTLTITGRGPGIALTIDGATNCSLSNTTDAAQAERVPAGVAIVRTGYDSTGNQNKGRRATIGAFTASTCTITYASVISGGEAGVTIDFGGNPQTISVLYDTSNTQTVTNLVAAVETRMNAVFPAGQSVVATNPSAGVMLITADVAGGAFNAVPNTTGTAAAVWGASGDTTPDFMNPARSLPAAYLGTSLFSSGMIESSPGAADPAYPPGANMNVGTGGPGDIAVPHTATAPTFGAGAWTDATSSSAGRGQYYFAGSASSSRVPLYLPGRGWLAVASGVSDSTLGIAYLRNNSLNG